MSRKIGRNALCPCGNGRKYKHCCLRRDKKVRIEQLELSRSRATTKTTVVSSASRAREVVDIASVEDVLAMRVPLPEGQGGDR